MAAWWVFRRIEETKDGRNNSTKALKTKLDHNDKIKPVETLAPERYASGHLPGAVNFPPERIKELGTRRLQVLTPCTPSSTNSSCCQQPRPAITA
jgi:hypothetical protein